MNDQDEDTRDEAELARQIFSERYRGGELELAVEMALRFRRVANNATPAAVNAHTLTLEFGRFLSEPEWRDVVDGARRLPCVQHLHAHAVVLQEPERPSLTLAEQDARDGFPPALTGPAVPIVCYCRCPPGACLLHPSLSTCSMRDALPRAAVRGDV